MATFSPCQKILMSYHNLKSVEHRQSQRLLLFQKMADTIDMQVSECFSCAKGYPDPNEWSKSLVSASSWSHVTCYGAFGKKINIRCNDFFSFKIVERQNLWKRNWKSLHHVKTPLQFPGILFLRTRYICLTFLCGCYDTVTNVPVPD